MEIRNSQRPTVSQRYAAAVKLIDSGNSAQDAQRKAEIYQQASDMLLALVNQVALATVSRGACVSVLQQAMSKLSGVPLPDSVIDTLKESIRFDEAIADTYQEEFAFCDEREAAARADLLQHYGVDPDRGEEFLTKVGNNIVLANAAGN